MDVQKDTTIKSSKRKIYFGAAVIGFLLLMTRVLLQPANIIRVPKEQLWIGEVKQGDLPLRVEGHGVFKSKYQRMLTTSVKATVEEILLKPGAVVGPESVIARLSQPDLQSQMNELKIKLSQSHAELRQLIVDQKRESLSEKANLAILCSEKEAVQLRLEAEKQLLSKGIVSEIDHQETRLKFKQLTERLNIEHEKLSQLSLVHEEKQNIQSEKIAQVESQISLLKEKQTALTVKAGISGVLQQLPINLGQSVEAGQQLAQIGSTHALIAMIDIPQIRSERVQIGQKVEFDTRRGLIQGEVFRLDPVIQDNSVKVEVHLSAELPKYTRPEMKVDATIYTGQIENTLYIERPVQAREHTTSELFRVDADSNLATQVKVQLGADSGQQIQVISGAKQGDRFILSETRSWQEQQIQILD
ncbi:efflux RND transporter periplasmic adaptor subunit [Algicola sagamiensis]|uniref:efflux RND transporter periplasmic adaptor subunit n=1 Tax=Algicola sagamiensis TaxID=163869 RepID=UPI000376B36A|nr:HlyD family efflux transporter periplasmic adaptor subunit [Algicola sagamiensis]